VEVELHEFLTSALDDDDDDDDGNNNNNNNNNYSMVQNII
jgi:hypothetical protein